MVKTGRLEMMDSSEAVQLTDFNSSSRLRIWDRMMEEEKVMNHTTSLVAGVVISPLHDFKWWFVK
uniref:Uncharacterized protein n=1 Tax=Peronospora matthiolae TaxID=2874970 RepID=A0AAV1UW89_9STRA